jgi:iron(III) transport system ATP-binding protein
VSISIRGLTKKFGETTAVNSLDLDIAEGEFLVLLGPSGCGKTTTMRCIAGLETPTYGTISIGGEVVFDHDTSIRVPGNKRNVGMVFQSYAIWPHMTVAQNVGYPLKMQKRPKTEIRQRVEDVLELVGLEGLGDRNASMLSGGQMQRVAVARSIVMEPRVLLFDEPLSNLDAKLRDRLRFELRELQKRLNITAVYVTHDQSEALALADRIAVMKDGSIIQNEAPHQVYSKPKTLFVADFIGAGNLLEAKVVERGPSSCAVQIDGAQLQIHLDQPAPPSDDVHVCIRRESIKVSKHRPDGANVWSGVVRVAVFMGNHVSYQIELDSGPTLYVDAFAEDELIPEQSNVFVHVPGHTVLLLED